MGVPFQNQSQKTNNRSQPGRAERKIRDIPHGYSSKDIIANGMVESGKLLKWICASELEPSHGRFHEP